MFKFSDNYSDKNGDFLKVFLCIIEAICGLHIKVRIVPPSQQTKGATASPSVALCTRAVISSKNQV